MASNPVGEDDVIVGRIRARLALILVLSAGAAGAQDDTPRPLFADDSPLRLTIEGPFRQLARDDTRRPERDGLVRYRKADGTEVVLDVAIRVRGNSRVELCSRSPLRLNFRRSQLQGTVFAGQNQLKLVVLCRRSPAYEDYLAQEYQIYRAFNALTEQSFRVRWLTVEYVETDARRPDPTIEPAFLIEEDWEVAARHGMQVVEVESQALGQLDPRATVLMSLFQYLIANTDWSGTRGPAGEECCHNASVIGPPGSDRGRVILPYDFDHAGIINASYAQPNEALGLRRVTQRLYRGYCATHSELDWAIRRVNERRAAVTAAFASEPASEQARARAVAFLNESYAILNDPLRRRTEIAERCRG